MTMSVALSPYKPKQGVYARSGAAAALLVLDLLASWRLFEAIASRGHNFQFFGLNVPVAVTWCAALFLVVAVLVGVVTAGLRTRIKFVDSGSRAFIDLLRGELLASLLPLPRCARTDCTISSPASLTISSPGT